MANQTTNGCGGGSALLPVSPFYAPRYHFGMLLGVDDFEAEQGYHRGKLRLHNAWLHGPGVVWGMRVRLARPAGEVRVEPGLALDAAGRELYLDAPACVSLGAWYAAHRDDPDVRSAASVGTDGSVTVPLHVIARFRACVARPVPSISEPCDAGGGGDGIAYSRAQETVELLIRPGAAPPRRDPYHQLRVLFSLDPAGVDDGDVAGARDAVLALPAGQQPAAYLDAFRRFAAVDEMALAPVVLPGDVTSLFPAGDDCEVALANLGTVVLEKDGDGFTFRSAPDPDNAVRPSHVATSTIQELLCGPLFRLDGAPSGPSGGPTPSPSPEPSPSPDPSPSGGPDAGGPRIDPAAVRLGDDRVTLVADRRLARGSVRPEAFSVSAFEVQRGWHDVEINSVRLQRDGVTIQVELASGFLGHLVRVIAKGTGPAPLLGNGHVPLAGRTGGPAGTMDDGHDFVLMISRSAP